MNKIWLLLPICIVFSSMAYAENVSYCLTSYDSDVTYYLKYNITSGSTCFSFYGGNVTLDCQGHWISTTSLSVVNGVYAKGGPVHIRNCTFFKWYNGVNFDYVLGGSIINNRFFNTSYGASLTYSNNTLIHNNIMDWGRYSYSIDIKYGDNNTASNNNASNSYRSIRVYDGNNNKIINNSLQNNRWGSVEVTFGNLTLVSDNYITGYSSGIDLHEASHSVISGNYLVAWDGDARLSVSESINLSVTNNTIERGGIVIDGETIEHYIHDIESNEANGKSIYYLKDKVGEHVPSNASQLIIVNSTDLLIEDMEFNDTPIGITAITSNNITIKNSNFSYHDDMAIKTFLCSDIKIINNQIHNNEYDIELYDSTDVTVDDNIVFDTELSSIYISNTTNCKVRNNRFENRSLVEITASGIWFYSSKDCIVSGNEFSWNSIYESISVGDSSYINFSNNTMYRRGMYFLGDLLEHYLHEIDQTNTLNGKPVYYYKNIKDQAIDLSDIGQLIIANGTSIVLKNLTFYEIEGLIAAFSSDIRIENSNFSNNYNGVDISHSANIILKNNAIHNNERNGVQLYYSNDVSVIGNEIRNNFRGIRIYFSNNNTIKDNSVDSNNYALYLTYANGNKISNNKVSFNVNRGVQSSYSNLNDIVLNDFINNSDNVYSSSSSNYWNTTILDYDYNGTTFRNCLGNYWHDYTGIDTDNDGVGETIYSVSSSDKDYCPLTNYFENYFITTILTDAVMNESFSDSSTMEEEIQSQNVSLNLSFYGDLEIEFNNSFMEIVMIDSGSFLGNGFFKGNWTATIEGVYREGSWQGTLFSKDERIYLKGTVLGGLKGIIDGFLSESINGSGIYDSYQAKWTLNHVGNDILTETLTVNGTVNYGDNYSFNSTLYILQSSVQGYASGHYNTSLGIVLNHVKIGVFGFSFLTYESIFGSGQGWTYDELILPNITKLTGFFDGPLKGILKGKLDETGSRIMSLSLERLDIGLPPVADLQVQMFGPGRVSPGETLDYILEYKNDGLKAVDEAILFFNLDPSVNFESSSGEYNEFYHSVSWSLYNIPPKYIGYLGVRAKVEWGLPQGSSLDSFTYALDFSESVEESLFFIMGETQQDAFFNGVNTPPDSNNGRSAGQFVDRAGAQWVQMYPTGGFWGGLKDAIDVQKATPLYYQVLTYQNGRPVVGWDPELGTPIYAPSNPQKITNYDGNEYYVYFTRTDKNGLKNSQVTNGDYGTLWAFSGGTRTAITALLMDNLKCDRLVLLSAMAGINDISRYMFELEQVRKKHPDMEIILMQSTKDKLAKQLSWLFQAKFGESDQAWLQQNNIVVNPDTITINGRVFSIDLEKLNKQGHGGLFEFFRDLLKAIPTLSAADVSQILQAKDPNIKYGPSGYILKDQKLNYTVEYENEGEGIAFGVYFTDTLDEDLDEETLEIGPVISTIDNITVIAPPGVYYNGTRTITWFVGEVGPGEGGFAHFNVSLIEGINETTDIINYATVYFPSVPEVTPTNAILSTVYIDYVDFSEGWNLVSLPVEATLPNISYLFSYNGSYVEHPTNTTLDPALGYWAKFGENVTVRLEGIPVDLKFNITPGLNLVGHPSLSETLANFNCSAIAYSYQNGWETFISNRSFELDSLEGFRPYLGYWINTNCSFEWPLD